MIFQVGDTVARKSYGNDILFTIIGINRARRIAFLKAIDIRLMADAPLDDLIKVGNHEVDLTLKSVEEKYRESVRLINQERTRMREKNMQFVSTNQRASDNVFEIPGKVLHIDGDKNYLTRCLNLYKELNIPVHGVYMNERSMPVNVARLVEEHEPQIVILTGHDAVKKSGNIQDPESYLHSKYFISAVEQIRKLEKNKDKLIIFAGACQSFFEALLEAGANFASSPDRINIQALDPVFVAEKCSYTSFRESINLMEMTKSTITGIGGIGGIETMGTFRIGVPKTNLFH